MKKLTLIIALILCLDLVASSSQNKALSNNADLNLLYLTSSDSLLSVIEDTPMILYMSGHNAHIWSVVSIKGGGYHIISGRINPYGKNVIYEPNESNVIDTVAFLSAHKEILSWGFDTLPSKARNMRSLGATEYSPFSSNLSIVGLDSVDSFNSRNVKVFSGPDSVVFNEKFKKLNYLMFWLAEPLVRKYTPDSVFISRTPIQ
ncbi:MAG: hypothetical protein NC418_07505 [Muribaculaceae bacterium]|nr:hypothetical protein [Muribaculaceae bacterium]